jgi:tetratricopeptide (TPR) repeat protein
VYDAGRRLYAHEAGLEPPDEVRVTFERLLAAEREATRRADGAVSGAGVPEGLIATARWIADDGDVDAAVSLALRGTWWWWLTGQRSVGRELLTDLLDLGTNMRRPLSGSAVLSARAWIAVYESVGLEASAAIDRARRTLELVGRPTWNRHDCLAATLIAERLFERGQLQPGRRLLTLAIREQQRRGDEWGHAFGSVVEARGALRAGDLLGARACAEAQLRRFLALGDVAGQMSCLDVIGYCAEATGDLETATSVHSRAAALARRTNAPEWEAIQLTRLGNVAALAQRPDALRQLQAASELALSLAADSVAAYADNGLGVAHSFAGDHAAAAQHHRAALTWYDAVGSTSGIAYTKARLSLVLRDAQLATASLTDAMRSQDPRAVAHSLEAVSLTTDDPVGAARALGAAEALRSAASDRLARPQLTVLERRRDELRTKLGPTTYQQHSRAAARHPMAEARRW